MMRVDFCLAWAGGVTLLFQAGLSYQEATRMVIAMHLHGTIWDSLPCSAWHGVDPSCHSLKMQYLTACVLDIAAVTKHGGASTEAAQKPLAILHGVLRGVASRLALNEAVAWAREAARAPPWAKLLRVEKSLLFSMGVR